MRTVLTAAAVLALAGVAHGQTWIELDHGDAPDGPFARQDTVGVGPLFQIRGGIDSEDPDYVDTYSIIITDVQAFYATTANHIDPAATASFDSRLWLWDEQGNIVLANDDDGPGLQSTISDPSTFAGLTGGAVNATASGVSLVAGRKYLLSIGQFANDPEDAAGTDLADLGAFSDLHGANPAAGPFDHWENTGTHFGDYVIALNGATYCAVPTPGSAALLALGGLAFIRRRR